jgi:adiponectin receptor
MQYVHSRFLLRVLTLIKQVRWPERSAPGAFDIWGNSHQIFHFFVILAAATHFYGMAKAFDYHHTIMGSQCLMD